MPESPRPPLLNPVLNLRMEPIPKPRIGGGKDSSKIVQDRLQNQQNLLSGICRKFMTEQRIFHHFAGNIHLIASMFDDSLSPSYLPDNIFNENVGCRLVAPVNRGYLLEVKFAYLDQLARTIEEPKNVASLVDISRVKKLHALDETSILRGKEISRLWNQATLGKSGKLFIVWFAPFRDIDARHELLDAVQRLSAERTLLPTYPLDGVFSVEHPGQGSIARATRAYRNSGHARATVQVSTPEQLASIVASGVSFRVEPVRPIGIVTSSQGNVPAPSTPDVAGQPIVAVIDGGLTSKKYTTAEAWRASPLVPDESAAKEHGNQVSSLLVQGCQWNPDLPLPELHCRLGTIQAIADEESSVAITYQQFVNFLRRVARDHPDTKVWSMSANVLEPEDDPDDVSDLGDRLATFARDLDILLVVSVGNVSATNTDRICAPADCEAALVVGGRQKDTNNNPGDGCLGCLPGPGPAGMLKPDLSWFSTLRMLGGGPNTGSSYATPLVSVLAAHTFANLKEPSPDLVRALLINVAEQNAHQRRLGWGTPYHGFLPWYCASGTVTLLWKAKLKPGTPYYWSDIPIPDELVYNNELRGGASLTAILRPLTSPFGGSSYFASRLETALQYTNPNGQWKNLLGSMDVDGDTPENPQENPARWHSVRRMMRNFNRRGIKFDGNQFRVYARVYTRDIYQFGFSHNNQIDAQEAVFVLTLKSVDESSPIYNTMAQALKSFVESAVVDQEIEIEI